MAPYFSPKLDSDSDEDEFYCVNLEIHFLPWIEPNNMLHSVGPETYSYMCQRVRRLEA